MGAPNTGEAAPRAANGRAERRPDPDTRRAAERYLGSSQSRPTRTSALMPWRSEINRGGFRAVDFLMEEVVEPGIYVGCASCATIA